jgi:hypothetical protein
VDHLPEHRDSLMCYTAHFAGAKEEVLREPLRIYRTGRGDKSASLAGAPPGSSEELVWLITQMRKLHAPLICNLDDWGLASSPLEEIVPVMAAPAAWREE